MPEGQPNDQSGHGQPATPQQVRQLASDGTEQISHLGHAAASRQVSLDDLAKSKRISQQSAYSWVLLGALGSQLIAANVAFYIFGYANQWEIGTTAIAAYFGATLGEVAALVVVIVRNLFPGGD